MRFLRNVYGSGPLLERRWRFDVREKILQRLARLDRCWQDPSRVERVARVRFGNAPVRRKRHRLIAVRKKLGIRSEPVCQYAHASEPPRQHFTGAEKRLGVAVLADFFCAIGQQQLPHRQRKVDGRLLVGRQKKPVDNAL